MNLFEELKRRNVFKAGIAYLVFSWLVLQIISIVFPILQIDIAIQRWVLIVLIITLPFWLVFAYIYEWTPKGFKKTVDISDEEGDFQKQTGKRSSLYIIMGLSLAIVLLITERVLNLAGDKEVESSISTIAILPFSHQSTDEESEFFTSGVHEDLMTKLAGIKNFRIISKSSVLPYKDFEGDLREIGRKLDVNYIMQGAIRRWNNQIRMTVQLIESASNQVIWSDEYDGNLENVFELQANIATGITQKLHANLSRDEQKELESAPTNVLAAYDDYLKARYILDKPRATYEDVLESVLLLNRAVDADKNFVEAWSLLILAQSEIYNKLYNLEGRSEEREEARVKAEIALEKARKLSPDSWTVLRGEGIFYMNFENDRIKALSSFEKALEQNPSDVETMLNLGKLYIYLGDIDKALEVGEHAFKLVQTSGMISYMLTFYYEVNGDYEKMIPLLERLYELYPEDKHYLVESKYYQFLKDGSLSSFNIFQESLKKSNASNPWDERALKNMEMVVAMFNDEFDLYHQDWKGKHENHMQGHGDWMCPLVANDFINQARILIEHEKTEAADAILEEVGKIVLKPINPNTVCIFNPQVYIPKLDYLNGNKERAAENIETLAIEVLQNENFPLGAVERSVLLQAADLILPDKVYFYYEQVVKNSISMTSFESICADPWTYPNLIKNPKFVEEIKGDGRFVAFLQNFGFLN